MTAALSGQAVPGRRLIGLVLLPFAGAFFLQELYRVVGLVVAPDLVRDLGLDARGIGLLTSIYFFTFAAMQLPAGLLLDRYGPRRVLSALLCFGIAGCLLFAVAPNYPVLVTARALLGIGGSTCLMASFTAAALWFGRGRLVLVNGVILGLGSLGGLVATVPVDWLLGFISWRIVWAGLAVLTLAAIAALLLVVPEPPGRLSQRSGWAGYLAVFRHPLFWRLAPATSLTQGGWLAYQGLWAGPWLTDIAGFDRGIVAAHILIAVIAAVPGYLCGGLIAERLQRTGWPASAAFAGGQMLFLLVQLAILIFPADATWITWALFGLLGTAGGLGFPILTQAMPPELAGRANTALNLSLFVGAFALQFGIGWMIGLWPQEPGGGYPPEAHRWTFAAQLLLQAMAVTWFFVSTRRLGRQGPP